MRKSKIRFDDVGLEKRSRARDRTWQNDPAEAGLPWFIPTAGVD
jgi:hypothetical protein